MDTNEYNAAVNAHSDALYRYAVRQLNDRDAAKDVVQECFLRLWKQVDRVQASKVRSYLFTAAHNTIVDHVRRRKYQVRHEPWHDYALTTVQPEAGLLETIEKGLTRLSAQQRSLVLLRDQEGFSYTEMCAMTGLSLEQVKVYLFRARSAMKHALADLGLVA